MPVTPPENLVAAWAHEAERQLVHARDAINEANVFPVPDSDTGTNMLVTLRQGLAELGEYDAPRDIDGCLQVLAHGALVGARGNSGVILAEYLQGFAAGIRAETTTSDDSASQPITATQLVAAIRAAAQAAYTAVSRPVPGTILSTAAVVAQAAESYFVQHPNAALSDIVGHSVEQAKLSVASGPQRLTQLRQAGVVDSGAVGLVVVLNALYDVLRNHIGHDLPKYDLNHRNWLNEVLAVHSGLKLDADLRDESHQDSHEFHDETASMHPYELMCLARGEQSDLDRIRDELNNYGDSVVVIQAATGESQDEHSVRIHLHTSDPSAVIAYLAPWELSDVVVHQVHEPYGERTWSWVAITAVPGLLAPIAQSGGIALLSTRGIVLDRELERVLTDTKNHDVLVTYCSQAVADTAEDMAARFYRLAQHLGKQVFCLPATHGSLSEGHLAVVAAHLALDADSDAPGAISNIEQVLSRNCDVVYVQDGQFPQLSRQAEIITVLFDSQSDPKVLDELTAAAQRNGTDIVTIPTGRAGTSIIAAVEGPQ